MPSFDDPGVCRSRSPLGRGRLGATLVLLTMCIAPIALAQTAAPKKPKKGAKPAASASAEPAPEPPPPPPAPAPEPEPAASASASASAESTETTAPAEDALSPDDPAYVKEEPGKKYYFVGLRYKGTVIPQFFENFFVDDGGTVYSNSLGLELDMRQDGRSMIPWIQYTDYSMGDTVFLTKGKPLNSWTDYSVVNSGLKAIYLGLDEMWSAPLANHWDFEYGFGVGIGFVFGTLLNNWVYPDPTNTSPLTAKGPGGTTYHLLQCQSEMDNPSCAATNHQNASVAKVGNYAEPNWFGGGSVPVVFPHISIPQIGIRYKPIKQVEARVQTGFSITGWWFSLSVDWGLEQNPKPADTGKPKDKGADKDKGDKDQGGDQPEKKKRKKKTEEESSGYYVPGRDTL
jgi:hypothetical protein